MCIEPISHPDTYARPIYDKTLRDAMQGPVGRLLAGQLEVGSGLEHMYRTLSAVLQERAVK
ncbi:MAG: hypothetical protein ACOYEP_09510 [Limnochordia bacterium]